MTTTVPDTLADALARLADADAQIAELHDALAATRRKPRAGSRSAEDMLFGRIRHQFPSPVYATLRGVQDATGATSARTADAIAMGCWRSRGLHLHGFEIKASRRDWLRELKDPSKAEQIARFCDRWWLVAADESIVHAGELPEPWGMFVPADKGNGLRVVREAALLNPLPLPRSFLAAVLRRTVEQHAPERDIERAVNDAVAVAREHERTLAASSAAARYDLLREQVDGFEAASGLSVRGDTWTHGAIGHAVKALVDAMAARRYQSQPFANARERLTRALEAIDGAEAAFVEAVGDIAPGGVGAARTMPAARKVERSGPGVPGPDTVD